MINHQIDKYYSSIYLYAKMLCPNIIYQLNAQDYTKHVLEELNLLSYSQLKEYRKQNKANELRSRLKEMIAAGMVLEIIDLLDNNNLNQVNWKFIGVIRKTPYVELLLKEGLNKEELELSMLFGDGVLCEGVALQKGVLTQEVTEKMQTTRQSIRVIITTHFSML